MNNRIEDAGILIGESCRRKCLYLLRLCCLFEGFFAVNDDDGSSIIICFVQILLDLAIAATFKKSHNHDHQSFGRALKSPESVMPMRYHSYRLLSSSLRPHRIGIVNGQQHTCACLYC